MRIQTTIAAAAALLSVAAPAHAAKIIGQLSFTGFVRPIGATNMSGATGLDFYNAFALGDPAGPGTILTAIGSTGVFDGIICAGPCGTIQDLSNFSVGPINSFFDIGSTIYFDLASITSVSQTTEGPGGSLTLTAWGNFRIAGYETTPGILSLTTQGNGLTSFSATALSAVPEPASWAMMIAGFGLMGGILRASRRSVRVRYSTN